MKIVRPAASALAILIAGCAIASAEPTKLWEASGGFAQPESAVADAEASAIYVSNVAGDAATKDGNGYISKLTLDGKVTDEKWIEGLDSPKGLALVGTKLYVADLAQLVEIDTAKGTIAKRYEASGAKILNGISADGDGRIYVTDWQGNAIWRLENGTFEKWLESADLKNPNGILVDGDKLIVAAWGAMGADFSTKTPGNLLTVSLADKSIANLGSGTPVGNLDGLKAFDAESFIVTDWVAGKAFQISRSGEAKELLTLSQGTADLYFNQGTRTAIIPIMVEGKVVAYKF
jgi:DNA-binding beta-propeller fold protein YncE